jgi:polyhydroxyalkanoate synthase
MSDFTIDPERARAEADAFASRWAQGMGALAAARELPIGTAPKDEIYREDKVVLYRYRAAQKLEATRVRTPLLICYALVNRPYMMDLQEDRSLIRRLLQLGVDVYLIDWGYPDGADRFLGMQDYIDGYLDRCVRAVMEASEVTQINLLGVCQGGTMSLCYAALNPERVRNLIAMVTPVDFRTPENLLTKWAQQLDVDTLIGGSGNIPGELLNLTFLALMPFRLTSQKYVGLLDQVDDPDALENFLRMEQWIFDSPDQPGEMFREFMTYLVKENRLREGTLEIAQRRVDLSNIRMPVLNLYATQDHLVPPSASIPLETLVGTQDYTAHAFKGGHIGIYVSSSAQRTVPTLIADWLRARDAQS